MVSTMELQRREAVAALLAERGDALVVTGLGSPTYDVQCGRRPRRQLLSLGRHGRRGLIGLGLALAQPKRRVLVITGDGEQLMALGALATIAVAKPRNLSIVVIDNQHYGETGMQASPQPARASISRRSPKRTASPRPERSKKWRRCEPFAESVATCTEGPAPVRDQSRGRQPATLDARARRVFIKNRFRAHLGFAPN